MWAMQDPTGRVLRLLSLLQTYKFWPGPELADQLEVSARTLRRDIDRLRELGYPVDATPGVSGGYRLAAGAHLPPLLLDDDEAVAIAVGLRAAAGASVEGIEDISIRALAKLEQVLPDRLRRRVRSVHANVTPLRWGGSGPTVDADALAILAQACRDHEELRFDYERRDGEQMRRLVEPYQLVSAGRRWYLVAWDTRREDWRTFRVDRMTGPRLAGARFDPRPLPAADAAEFVAASLNSVPMPFEAAVIVQGDGNGIADVARRLGADVETVDTGDERFRVHLRADNVEGLTSMVAILAVDHQVSIAGSDELTARVAQLAGHLSNAT
jgi:predicted DNA-binding transcriptional regulator YafY